MKNYIKENQIQVETTNLDNIREKTIQSDNSLRIQKDSNQQERRDYLEKNDVSLLKLGLAKTFSINEAKTHLELGVPQYQTCVGV